MDLHLLKTALVFCLEFYRQGLYRQVSCSADSKLLKGDDLLDFGGKGNKAYASVTLSSVTLRFYEAALLTSQNVNYLMQCPHNYCLSPLAITTNVTKFKEVLLASFSGQSCVPDKDLKGTLESFKHDSKLTLAGIRTRLRSRRSWSGAARCLFTCTSTWSCWSRCTSSLQCCWKCRCWLLPVRPFGVAPCPSPSGGCWRTTRGRPSQGHQRM